MLSKVQKEKFLEISGNEYNGNILEGEFMTEYPYNDKEWQYSPWNFRFKIDLKTKNLYCELSHRMTNNRMYGWNSKGEELSLECVEKIYPNTDPIIDWINKNK